MKQADGDYHYRSLVSQGENRRFVGLSVIFHLMIVILLLTGPLLFRGGTVLTLQGGGGTGETIGIGLVGELPAGQEYFKPPVRQIEAVTPVRKETPPEEPPLQENDFVTDRTDTPVPTQPDKPSEQVDPAGTSPKIGTAEKPTGVLDATGAPGSSTPGGGGGLGVSVGGSGEGFLDSWYARQVEQRVGKNWLQSQMGVVYSGRHRVVIQFEVTTEGRIVDIEILQSTGPEAFERSAIRAVRASDPLPPLPNRYRIHGNRVRFVAVFEYPTP
ncbi:MAG: TonB family protein [Acidobacteria bacterium]|nr:TonB family protein [Acidobacteriota bacterium]